MRMLNKISKNKICVVDLRRVPVSVVFFFFLTKRSPSLGSSQSSWKKTVYTNIVWLFLKFGKGGGETEIKLAQMLSLENLQVSWEVLFQNLENRMFCSPGRRVNQGDLPGGSTI